MLSTILTNAAIIAAATTFLHVCTWQGMIFGKPAAAMREILPEWLTKPLFDCPVCMAPWWGVYILLGLRLLDLDPTEGHIWPETVLFWLLSVSAAGGLNVVTLIISKWYENLHEESENREPQVLDLDNAINDAEHRLDYLKSIKQMSK